MLILCRLETRIDTRVTQWTLLANKKKKKRKAFTVSGCAVGILKVSTSMIVSNLTDPASFAVGGSAPWTAAVTHCDGETQQRVGKNINPGTLKQCLL